MKLHVINLFLFYFTTFIFFFFKILKSDPFMDFNHENQSYTLDNIHQKQSISNGRMRSFKNEELEFEEFSSNLTNNPKLFSNFDKNHSQVNSIDNQTIYFNSSSIKPYIYPLNHYINEFETDHIIYPTSSPKPAKKFFFIQRKLNNETFRKYNNDNNNNNKTLIIPTEKVNNYTNNNDTKHEDDVAHILFSTLRNLSNVNSINKTTSYNLPTQSEMFENVRFCLTPGDCYLELNERCVFKGKYSICDCERTFYRDEITRSCQIKKLVRFIFNTSYVNNFLNSSKSTIKLRQSKIKLRNSIWSYVNYSNYLNLIIQNVEIVELNNNNFQTTIDFYLKNRHLIKYNNYIENNYIQELSTKLSQAVRNISKSNDFQIIDIINDINPCTISSLNFCSENAFCKDTAEDSEIGFKCSCMNGYTDLSPHPQFTGEVCQMQCGPDSCYNDGFCIVNNGKNLECRCLNWDFGNRCQFSGALIFSIAGLLIIMTIIIVTFSLSILCGYKSNLKSNTSNKDIDEESNKSSRVTFESSHYDLPHPYINQNLLKYKKSDSSIKEDISPVSLENDNESVHNFEFKHSMSNVQTQTNKLRKSSFSNNKLPRINTTHVTWC